MVPPRLPFDSACQIDPPVRALFDMVCQMPPPTGSYLTGYVKWLPGSHLTGPVK